MSTKLPLVTEGGPPATVSWSTEAVASRTNWRIVAAMEAWERCDGYLRFLLYDYIVQRKKKLWRWMISVLVSVVRLNIVEGKIINEN